MSIERHISPQRIAELIEYDPATGRLTWRERAGNKKHNNRWAGRPALARRQKHGHLGGMVLRRVAMAHRVAWAIHYGEWPAGTIDHINGDPSDNRINNLRVVTPHQNSMNRHKKVGTTSNFHGVYYCRRDKRFYAFVKHKCKTHYVGCFSDEEEAARARDIVALRLRGEFAVLNFPGGA